MILSFLVWSLQLMEVPLFEREDTKKITSVVGVGVR